jgi:hypothetical protein
LTGRQPTARPESAFHRFIHKGQIDFAIFEGTVRSYDRAHSPFPASHATTIVVFVGGVVKYIFTVFSTKLPTAANCRSVPVSNPHSLKTGDHKDSHALAAYMK